MKQAVRITILIVVILGLILSACGSGPAPPPATRNPVVTDLVEEATEVSPVDEAEEELPPNLIRVGIFTDSAPFVSEQGDGNYVGFDIELIEAIAAEAGLEIRYVVEPDFYSIFKNLNDPDFTEYDLAISGLTITPEREELVDFSDPYFKTGQAILVTGEGSVTINDLNERQIGVQAGTTGQKWCVERFTERNDNPDGVCIPFPNIMPAIEALGRGDVAAVVHDYPVAAGFVENDPGLTLLDGFFSEEFYGIAVHQDRPDLLAAVNNGLAALLPSSNRYREICENWIDRTEQCLISSSAVPELSPAKEDKPAAEKAPTLEPADAEATTEALPLLPCDLTQVTPTEAGQVYEIQEGDWLSRLAEQEYGNPLDYRAIVEHNNQKCRAEEIFTCIDNPDQIKAGWTIYLPTPAEVEAYWDGQLVSLPPVDWSVSGQIDIAGSSTVFPLTRQMQVCFEQEGFGGTINLASTGTLAGFEQFCTGEIDIVNASVPMSDSERQICQANGREPVEFQIGTDALAIAVSSQNEFVQDVTAEELQQILAEAATWSAVRPEWPNQAINRYYPTPRSGTFESLVNILFEGDQAALLNAANIKLQSERDEELVAGIQKDPLGVGFFGYAYYERNKDRLQTLPVQGVRPRPESVDQGTYPLLRPLFIYAAAETIQQKPQVAAFINYYLGSVKNYVTDVGYFLPDEETFQRSIQNLNQTIQ